MCKRKRLCSGRFEAANREAFGSVVVQRDGDSIVGVDTGDREWAIVCGFCFVGGTVENFLVDEVADCVVTGYAF